MGRYFGLGKCVDCGTRQKVRPLEWNRAKQPRCRVCGGRLEPSKATTSEHASAHDEIKRQVSRKG